jgi:hypothetical protein
LHQADRFLLKFLRKLSLLFHRVPHCSRGTLHFSEASPWPTWLGEVAADVPHLKALLAPYPSDEMICWPVSARVGNVKNNDPSLIEPVAAA